MPCPERPSAETRRLNERPYPGPAGRSEYPEPVTRQDPVLTNQGNDVGDGGEGHQVEQMQRKIGRKPKLRDKRLSQLECDAGSAKLPRHRSVLALRVEHGVCGRQAAREMVVGNHDVETRGFGLSHRIDRRDPTVTGHDQPGSGRCRRSHARRAKIVSVPHPVRHKRGDAATRRSEQSGQQNRAALPVHVVVAVDQNRPPCAHRVRDQSHRGIHVPNRKRVTERVQGRAQKRLGGLGPLVAALDQQPSQQRGDVERIGQRHNVLRPRLGGDAPPRRLGDHLPES